MSGASSSFGRMPTFCTCTTFTDLEGAARTALSTSAAGRAEGHWAAGAGNMSSAEREMIEEERAENVFEQQPRYARKPTRCRPCCRAELKRSPRETTKPTVMAHR